MAVNDDIQERNHNAVKKTPDISGITPCHS